MHQMAYSTLVSAQELAAHIDDPHWVVLDARFDIDDETAAKRNFAAQHIPGALQADLADHMAGPIIAGRTGRRPLPDPSTFADTLSSWGIDDTTQVVIYDDMNGIMAASRLWFMLKWAGHDVVAVLDGGYQAWIAQGGALTAEVAVPRTATFTPNFRHELVVSLDEVEALSRERGALMFDSRSTSDGIPSHDAIQGRIPGSVLADRALNSTADGRWRTAEELRAHYASLIGDSPSEDVIFYCGSGVTGAQNVLGMAHAGFPNARLYVGSWSEWILDPSRHIQA